MASTVKSCPRCKRSFITYAIFNRHLKQCRVDASIFKCSKCDKTFSRKYNLQRHFENFHDEDSHSRAFQCGVCVLAFPTQEMLLQHRRWAHENVTTSFTLRQSAHNRALQQLRLMIPKKIKQVERAQMFCAKPITVELKRSLSLLKRFKYTLILHVEMVKLADDGRSVEESIVFPFRSLAKELSHSSQIRTSLFDNLAFMKDSILEFLHRGSGWILSDILFMDLEIGKCRVLAGACGKHSTVFKKGIGQMLDMKKGFVKQQPKKRKRKKCKDQMENNADCFYMAVASHFFSPKKVTDRKLRKFVKENMNDVRTTPMKVSQIENFEKRNAHLDLSISVLFSESASKFIPLKPGKNVNAKNQIVLVLYYLYAHQKVSQSNIKQKKIRTAQMHYVRVEDPLSFFAEPETLKSGRIYRRKKFVCFQCFNAFSRQETYDRHVSWCHTSVGQRLVYPEKGEKISFDARLKSYKTPYTIFYDFEALQTKAEKPCSCDNETLDFHKKMQEGDESQRASMILDQVMRKTWEKKRHKMMRGCPHKITVEKIQKGFAYHILVIDRHGKVTESINYAGNDAPSKFCDEMSKLNERLKQKINDVVPLKLTKKDKAYLASNPQLCILCSNPLSQYMGGKPGRVSVRHHDHINGRFIGLAHDYCNFITRERLSVAVFSHNFSSYDSHLFLKEMGEARRDGKFMDMEAIPLNGQKIKCLKMDRLFFLDSISFLPAPLAELTNTLVNSNHKFPLLQQWEENDEKRSLLLRKGVYPYAYATSIKRLESTMSLPPIEEFKNDIGDEECSPEDYAHAQKVFDTFECKNMQEYTMLYLATDTYLLAEAVMSLRNMIHHEFGLDLCQYWSLPMMSKDLMLKMTGVEIDLMHDVEMCAMVRNNIRGGLSYVNQRYFDVEKERKNIGESRSVLYADANNLYGAAMSLPLPKGDFKWLSKRGCHVLQQKWRKKLSLKRKKGYILEVTLDYPKKLHRKHSSFPLAPEHIQLDESKLSPYASRALFKLNGQKKYKSRKLTSTFLRRKRYVVHGANLKFYLEQGLKLVKIHRGIKFTQEDFIKPYIDACTRLRAQAKTKERKDVFKLLCNSLFGKVRKFSSFFIIISCSLIFLSF